VAVVAPAFAGGSDAALEDARRAAAWLREEAAVQGVDVRRHLRRGNPIRVMHEMATEGGLLVIGMPQIPVSPWRLGVASHLVRGVDCSVLLVPSDR
jgi:nucleotide-binding universal stress UspA family protein